MLKNKISKEAINQVVDVPVNAYTHFVLHILPENTEVELFIKNTVVFSEDIKKLSNLNSCEYFEQDSQEYDFLVEMIKKHAYQKVINK
jgi:hypothetical protein